MKITGTNVRSLEPVVIDLGGDSDKIVAVRSMPSARIIYLHDSPCIAKTVEQLGFSEMLSALRYAASILEAYVQDGELDDEDVFEILNAIALAEEGK